MLQSVSLSGIWRRQGRGERVKSKQDAQRRESIKRRGRDHEEWVNKPNVLFKTHIKMDHTGLLGGRVAQRAVSMSV